MSLFVISLFWSEAAFEVFAVVSTEKETLAVSGDISFDAEVFTEMYPISFSVIVRAFAGAEKEPSMSKAIKSANFFIIPPKITLI